eukprot:scaffold12227_cov171-Isochrysis_galbana.AAC.3
MRLNIYHGDDGALTADSQHGARRQGGECYSPNHAGEAELGDLHAIPAVQQHGGLERAAISDVLHMRRRCDSVDKVFGHDLPSHFGGFVGGLDVESRNLLVSAADHECHPSSVQRDRIYPVTSLHGGDLM